MAHLNPTLRYLNGVQSYYSPAQGQQASQGVASGLGGGWMPSLSTPLVIPTSIGGGNGGHAVNVIAADPAMLQEMRNQQQEDNEQSRATTAAVVGGIGTIVLAGLSALALRGYCDDREELQRAYDYRSNNLPRLEQGLMDEMTPIVNAHIGILEAKTGRARNILIITGAALVTGATAFIAGMLAIQWLITAAIVVTVAIAAIGVFLVVWHLTEKTTLSPEMQEDIATLREALSRQQTLREQLNRQQDPLIPDQSITISEVED
jgi:hypothetical protein